LLKCPIRLKIRVSELKPNHEVVIMADSLVVKAKIKDAAKGFNVAGDFADALSDKVQQLINDACERAKANGRRTVMSKDI
jgi:hypothetical protein